MKRDKKYYLAMSLVVFICLFILSMYNFFNIIGYIILLTTYITFNSIWDFYHKAKGK